MVQICLGHKNHEGIVISGLWRRGVRSPSEICGVPLGQVEILVQAYSLSTAFLQQGKG